MKIQANLPKPIINEGNVSRREDQVDETDVEGTDESSGASYYEDAGERSAWDVE